MIDTAVRIVEQEKGLPVTRVYCAGGAVLYQGRYGNGIVEVSDRDEVVFSDGSRFKI